MNAERMALGKALKEAGNSLEKITIKQRVDARKSAAQAAGLGMPQPMRGSKKQKQPEKE